ncbi:MAG: patatin-like phospholipase family protein [Acidimicrobiia bacterium]|jgi:NTE family protein|nr:patatin-like phospholipase family protein [Acidimicrobiia bacterium]
MASLLERVRRRPEPIAFVLGGGGNLGAIQVGMLRALAERGVVPDLVVGCSVGALNGLAFAQEPTLVGVARLEQLWRALDGKDVMPTGWMPTAVQLARRGVAIHANDGLRKVIESVVDVAAFEDLPVRFECVATDMDNAREVWFGSGPLVEPILASAALPSVYPPVTIDGVRYIDGAVVNDVPVSRAVALGARRIYVLHVGSFDRPLREPKRPIDVAVLAYWIARRHRFHRDLTALPRSVEAIVLPTGDPPRIPFNDFRRSQQLIDAAYQATTAHLVERARHPVTSGRAHAAVAAEPSQS